MHRHWRLYFAVVLVLAMQVAVVTIEPALALDCKSLSEEIKHEKSLLVKRTKLADAVKVCPNSAEINYSYGYALERLRDYEQAIQYYKIATGLNSKFASAYLGLGDVYLVLGEVKASVDAYEKGLHLAPGDLRAKKSLESARSQLKAAGGKQKQEEAAEAPKVAMAPPVAVSKQPSQVSAVEKSITPARQPASPQVEASVAVVPVVEQPPKNEGSETDAHSPGKKSEKQLVLEPRASKTAVASKESVIAAPLPAVIPEAEKAKVEEVKQAAVIKKTESQKKRAQEIKEGRIAASEAAKSATREDSAAVSIVPAAPVGQSVKAVSIDIQPGRRIAPEVLHRTKDEQVAAFRMALEKGGASRQRLVMPELKGGIELSAFKKIQDSRREEIANTAKIDALPVDAERQIIPLFKEKHLATPQEPVK